jgi:formylglycine-generating enzyme required for sulfatase activity
MLGTTLENPSWFSACGDACPVENVSWNDVQLFLTRLNQQDPGKSYRLPTEAEWEYAARAGTTGDYGIRGPVCSFAWMVDDNCSQLRTWPVALKPTNAWLLHDMHGNVWEWVNDWYAETSYSSGPNTDPLGPTTGSLRVVRGGGFSANAPWVRSAVRGATPPVDRVPSIGFRLARSP